MPVLHVDRTDRSRRPRGKPRHGRTRLSFLLRRGLDWRSLLRRRRCPPRTRRVPARRGQPGEVASTLSRFCLVLTHDPQVQSFLITPHAARIALIRASPSSSRHYSLRIMQDSCSILQNAVVILYSSCSIFLSSRTWVHESVHYLLRTHFVSCTERFQISLALWRDSSCTYRVGKVWHETYWGLTCGNYKTTEVITEMESRLTHIMFHMAIHAWRILSFTKYIFTINNQFSWWWLFMPRINFLLS